MILGHGMLLLTPRDVVLWSTRYTHPKWGPKMGIKWPFLGDHQLPNTPKYPLLRGYISPPV